MKSFTIILSVLIVLFSTEGKEEIIYDLAILNVSLIDGTGKPIQEKVNLFIEDSRIAEISQT